MLRSFLLLTTPCFLTVFTLVVVWASTLPFPPLASAQRIFTLFSIVQAWVPFSKTNCHHPLYSNICLYSWTTVRLYHCTSVRLYVCTSVLLYSLNDSPLFMSAGSTEPPSFLHLDSKLGFSTHYIVLVGVITLWHASKIWSKQFRRGRRECCFKPPLRGWRGGYILRLEVRWNSGNGGQPQPWRLLQCGYHLHNTIF